MASIPTTTSDAPALVSSVPTILSQQQQTPVNEAPVLIVPALDVSFVPETAQPPSLLDVPVIYAAPALEVPIIYDAPASVVYSAPVLETPVVCEAPALEALRYDTSALELPAVSAAPAPALEAPAIYSAPSLEAPAIYSAPALEVPIVYDAPALEVPVVNAAPALEVPLVFGQQVSTLRATIVSKMSICFYLKITKYCVCSCRRLGLVSRQILSFRFF